MQALVVGIAYIIFKHSARRKAKKKNGRDSGGCTQRNTEGTGRRSGLLQAR